jgi:hypothetical protein
MKAPRRYRLAVLAYPTAYREARGRELLATLADGDDDRGGPSTREAAALAYRGLQQRAGIAVSGEGLLTMAALLVLLTATFSLTWAERTFLFEGEVAVSGTDGPGRWWGLALVACAFTVLAAVPFSSVDEPRRRRRAALAAIPIALVVMAGPFGIFQYMWPSPGELADYLWWNVTAVYANRTLMVPDALLVAAGAWVLLKAVSGVAPRARFALLAGALAFASAGCIVATWARPDLPAEYGQSAFADLGPAVFVSGLAALLALAAVARRGSRVAAA